MLGYKGTTARSHEFTSPPLSQRWLMLGYQGTTARSHKSTSPPDVRTKSLQLVLTTDLVSVSKPQTCSKNIDYQMREQEMLNNYVSYFWALGLIPAALCYSNIYEFNKFVQVGGPLFCICLVYCRPTVFLDTYPSYSSSVPVFVRISTTVQFQAFFFQLYTHRLYYIDLFFQSSDTCNLSPLQSPHMVTSDVLLST